MKNKLLNRWFGHAASASAASQVKLRDGLTILIVDDSRTQLFALEKLLKAEGVKTCTAENGKQGILMARHVKPDLILMDIVMPEINGFQATRYLSRQKDTGHIPIIIISGSNEQSDKTWGLKLGAKDYLQKPVDKNLLLKKISHWTAEVGVEKPVPVERGKGDHGSTWVEAG
ncbi:MAG: two-component system response regulator [endosymbiont of Galathealinum brachiosum]|uniref:Two-component system response regulator n=1 Tax=endosymbiont of Galathealinum brachiosum TaxID=2200906 RepID=A0A370DFA3_9GAMM|nr:MAG: two-component system response regulator [endosymbiont of Galathealinum brachiosum]